MRKRILMILAVFTVSISGCAGTKDLTTTLEFDTQQKIPEYGQYSESSQPQTDSSSEEVNSEASGAGETADTAKIQKKVFWSTMEHRHTQSSTPTNHFLRSVITPQNRSRPIPN